MEIIITKTVVSRNSNRCIVCGGSTLMSCHVIHEEDAQSFIPNDFFASASLKIPRRRAGSFPAAEA